MPKSLKAVLALTALAAAALVPLYGDPRATSVTHPEWGRMLLRGLGLEQALPAESQASLVFSVLSWKSSLAHRADRYVRADGVEVVGQPRGVRAFADPGEAAYPVAVVRPGDYRIRLRLSGAPDALAAVELRRAGDPASAKSFSIRPPAASGWVEAGVTHLDPGAWTASVSLPSGALLEYVEFAPPCLNAVEPIDGWKPTKVTDDVDLAVTLLKAMDREDELPPAASPIEVPPRAFQRTDAPAVMEAALSQAHEVRAGTRGLRALVSVDVPEDGLYTVSVFGDQGEGQRWLADGCHKAIVCSTKAPAAQPGWHSVLTAELTAGRHVFSVTLGPDATIQRLRLEQKKRAGEDYVAAIHRLGFDPGPAGPITRAKARDAIDWLQQRRAERLGQECGDWDLSPAVQSAQSQFGQQPSEGFTPGGRPAPVPPPPGQGPLSPPAVPPQEPASPVLP